MMDKFRSEMKNRRVNPMDKESILKGNQLTR